MFPHNNIGIFSKFVYDFRENKNFVPSSGEYRFDYNSNYNIYDLETYLEEKLEKELHITWTLIR